MNQVFKYSLNIGTTIVGLPLGAKVLSVQMQRGTVTMWALVDPSAMPLPRMFDVVGTGWNVPEDGIYRGTVQAGDFVWHAFEIPHLSAEQAAA